MINTLENSVINLAINAEQKNQRAKRLNQQRIKTRRTKRKETMTGMRDLINCFFCHLICLLLKRFGHNDNTGCTCTRATFGCCRAAGRRTRHGRTKCQPRHTTLHGNLFGQSVGSSLRPRGYLYASHRHEITRGNHHFQWVWRYLCVYFNAKWPAKIWWKITNLILFIFLPLSLSPGRSCTIFNLDAPLIHTCSRILTQLMAIF